MVRKPQFTRDGVRHATINGHRFHLRLTDPTAESFIWIDGRSPPLVLDQVAAELVAHLIDAMWDHQSGAGDESEAVRRQVVDRMYGRYGSRFGLHGRRVTRPRIAADVDRIFGTLMAVAGSGCPVEHGLGFREVRQQEWAAPARMDLAVTYRCNLDCPHCYAGGPRETAELAAGDWIRIYETLWSIGVPHVVFTGGEPTLREDLVRLVAEAEELVTGLVTNGTRLAELAAPLKDASLDYIQVTLESHDPAVHDAMVGVPAGGAHRLTVNGITAAVELGIPVITNTTLTSANAGRFDELLRFGKELGLTRMACNALICSGRGRPARAHDPLAIADLAPILQDARALAQELGIALEWYTPTCYRELDPVALGFGPKSCSAAAHNMTIQPDGTVLPCQSWPAAVGSIMNDPWPQIWNHPACRKLREHGFGRQRAECAECADLELCGGGCPLDQEAS